MRSTLGSMKSTNLHSSIGAGLGSMSAIRVSSKSISKEHKFIFSQQIPNSDKFFFGTPLTQKDYNDIKKLGYTYRKYQNGDVFYGQQNQQRAHGNGIYVFHGNAPDRRPYFYNGGFQNGEYNGFGNLCKMINDRQAVYCYQGNWKNGKREGEGKQNYMENTMFYRGSWLNDQRHGQGTLVMPDGSFEGMWLNGRMNGEGTLTLERGPLKAAVSGNWFDDDIREGKIRYFSKQTSQQLGQYSGGINNLMRQGQGTYRTGNIQLKGTFNKDELVGYSQIQNTTNQARYLIKGDYTQPQLQGLQAEITYNNNDRYRGLVDITPNNIIRRTMGQYYFNRSGSTLDGDFDDNERGQLILKNMKK